jgi:Glyoxalase-like domain
LTQTVVDHLVVAAASLEQGVAWCQATLGFTPTAGGKHPLMGTHNRVFSIATAEYPLAYFEIIAIDPEAPAPGRPRWYGLDDAALQARMAEAPRLIHSVARTTMLDMHRWGLINVGQRPGDPVAVERDTPNGRLSWQLLVPDDGQPDCAGALPTLIQWQGLHPAENLPASGITLKALTLRGVPTRARDVLRLRGVQVLPEGRPALTATLLCARGEVVLESAA